MNDRDYNPRQLSQELQAEMTRITAEHLAEEKARGIEIKKLREKYDSVTNFSIIEYYKKICEEREKDPCGRRIDADIAG